MNKFSLIISIIVTALLSSLATALLFNLINNQVPSTPSNTQGKLLKRISELEETIAKDQAAINQLFTQISKGEINQNNKDTQTVANIDIAPADLPPEPNSLTPDNIDELFQQRHQQRIARLQTDYRRQNLISAGFSEEDANLILNSESEVALQSLNDRYKRQRDRYQQSLENGNLQQSNQELLRERLGDENYERYLQANDFQTNASVNSILENSPGFNAGVQSGDQITHYDGERVFNLRDVNQLTLQGDEGESVLVEIIRDGEPVQVAVPRGPIGIINRRRGFGF